MSNYSNLKATINANVKTNNNEEITGSILNTVLNAMVDSLGDEYLYKGIATPTTDPGTPDQKVFYIAATPGTYTNFGGLVVYDGEVAILKWDTVWSKALTGAASSDLALYGKKIPWTLFGNGGYVKYDDGSVQSSSICSVIRWVDVSEFAGGKIYYSRVNRSVAFGNQGMAFYDANYTYISGISPVLNTPTDTMTIDAAEVPVNAKYAAFSCYTTMVSDFQIYYHAPITPTIDDIYAELAGKEDKVIVDSHWSSNENANLHIEEFYIEPQYFTSGMKITTINVRADDFALQIKDSSNNVVFLRSMGWQIKQSYPILPYNDLMIPLYRYSDNQMIGYVKLKYTGADYAASSINYTLDGDVVTNINNSPTIKEIYNSDTECVLFGDSLTTYPAASKLLFISYVTNRLRKKVWNVGCGGCTMAYRTTNGTDYYDSFTFIKLVESFLTGVYDNNQLTTQDYANAIKSLQSIDKTKRLLIINEYGVNDYQNTIAKGDIFMADAETYDINALDKTTLLGAMSYGIARLYETKPDIKYTQVTMPYIVFNDRFGYADMTKTSLGSFKEWCESIAENAMHLGVPCVMGIDMQTGRNFFNNRASGVNTVDGNHANEFGMYFIAQAFARVYEDML